jgi:hypothetical protein
MAALRIVGSNRGWATKALVVVLCGVVGACVQPVGPARTADDYERKAKDTAETVLSAVRTAALAVDVADRGRAFSPYVSVVLSDAEDDASGAAATFSSVQPPGASSDRLRAELTDLLDEAANALSGARIAARRADGAGLAAEARPLRQVADELDRFVSDHE